jgi:hypothetical protein
MVRPVRPADNPFASHRIERVAVRPADAVEQIVARLETVGWRGAIVGPHGSGKTVLAERLLGPLGSCGELVTVRMQDAAPLRVALAQLPAELDGVVIVLDGAEQLGALAWRRWCRHVQCAAGLVVTQHRPGRLPTVWRCETSPGLLGELIAELAPELEDAVRRELEALWRRHGGNLRECLRELYDRCASAQLPL